MKTPCIIHYAIKNTAPDPCWREMAGHAITQGHRGGPKNILVETRLGKVVIPRGNVIFTKRTEIREGKF